MVESVHVFSDPDGGRRLDPSWGVHGPGAPIWLLGPGSAGSGSPQGRRRMRSRRCVGLVYVVPRACFPLASGEEMVAWSGEIMVSG